MTGKPNQIDRIRADIASTRHQNAPIGAEPRRLHAKERLAALREFPATQQQAAMPEADCDAYRSWAFRSM